MEALFGQIRTKGGRNDNPTVQQFNDSAISLRVDRQQLLTQYEGTAERVLISL